MKNLLLFTLLFATSSLFAETIYLECNLSGKETSVTNGNAQEKNLSNRTLPVEILQTESLQNIDIKGADPYDIYVSSYATNGKNLGNYTDSRKYHIKNTSQVNHQGTNILMISEIEISRMTGHLLATRILTTKNQSSHSNIFTSLAGPCRKLENTRKF
jgi:hypothetical protein